MKTYFDSLQKLVTSEMVSKAAKSVGENEQSVAPAFSIIVASLLAVLMKRGDMLQMKILLDEAGNLSILSDIDSIIEENPTQEQQKIGDAFLQLLLADKAVDFTDPIAEQTNISVVATNRLISIITPLVCAFLGTKIVNEEWTIEQLLDDISSQKDHFIGFVPPQIISTFHLSSVVKREVLPPEKKKSNSWLWWIVLIILLLLVFVLWRSCKTSETVIVQATDIILSTVISHCGL